MGWLCWWIWVGFGRVWELVGGWVGGLVRVVEMGWKACHEVRAGGAGVDGGVFERGGVLGAWHVDYCTRKGESPLGSISRGRGVHCFRGRRGNGKWAVISDISRKERRRREWFGRSRGFRRCRIHRCAPSLYTAPPSPSNPDRTHSECQSKHTMHTLATSVQ